MRVKLRPDGRQVSAPLSQGPHAQVAQRHQPNRSQRPNRPCPILAFNSELLPVQRKHLIDKSLAPQHHPISHMSHPQPQHLPQTQFAPLLDHRLDLLRVQHGLATLMGGPTSHK